MRDAFMGGSTNCNRNPKEGMTGSIDGFSVEESWGPDPMINGRQSRYKHYPRELTFLKGAYW